MGTCRRPARGRAAAWLAPFRARLAGLIAQGFALLGTLVGAYVIIIGIGPQTRLDGAYHAVLLAMLAAGLATTWRASACEER